MFLLHNFVVSTRTFQTDANSPTAHHDSPINLAFKHHYLLHCILGLSALQLFGEDPSNLVRYNQATAHQDAAIRMARPHLINLTAEHSEAIFWFSSFTTMFSLAEPIARPTPPGTDRDYVEDWLHSIALSRGINMVLRQMPETSDIKRATAPEHWQEGKQDIQNALVDLREQYPQLSHLENFIRKHCEDSNELEECLNVVEKLFSYIAVLQKDLSDRKKLYLIQIWSMDLPDVFIQMCYEKKPAAIAILAFYGVAMHTRSFVWFFRGWPHVFLQECERHFRLAGIPSDGVLQWPRSMICEV